MVYSLYKEWLFENQIKCQCYSNGTHTIRLYGPYCTAMVCSLNLCSTAHINRWIAKYERLGIQITAKKAVETIVAYQVVTSNY